MPATDPARTDALLSQVEGLLAAGRPLWLPLPGPQRLALESPADHLLYGGAAGGGKSDLLLGLALTRHRRSILFRRDYGQLAGLQDRLEEILGLAGLKQEPGRPRRRRVRRGAEPVRLIEFGACHRPGSERAFQGRAHDLKAFDEITHFSEGQFLFLSGWLRSARAGQRCRVVAAGNPPVDAAGEWVLRYWRDWLDPAAGNRAEPGSLRWYARPDGPDGAEEPVADSAAVRFRGRVIRPISRSFIPAKLGDNPFLAETGYAGVLLSLPEPLRSQLLEGQFAVRAVSDPWAVIPAAWVAAAQARWQALPAAERAAAEMQPEALGLDIARGGRDRTVLVGRRGLVLAPPVAVPGVSTPDGPSVLALLLPLLEPQRAGPGLRIGVDVCGVGGAVYDLLRGHGLQVVALNGGEASHARDRGGRLGFANRRAEWWWRLREALDPATGSGLCLPPGAELAEDLAGPRFSVGVRGIQVEAKAALRPRLGRSPDLGDAVVYALVAGQGGSWSGPMW